MKIYRVIIVLIFFSGIQCSYNKNSSCKNFRTGRFHLYSRYDSVEFTINRNDSFQIETIEKTKLSTKWKVNWINDCEYQTIFIEKIPGNNLDTLPIEYKNLTHKIIETGENYYIYSTKLDDNFILTDTLWTTAKN